MTSRIIAAVVIGAIAVLVVLNLLTGFFVDWDWFASLGFIGVFRIIVETKVLLFAAAFAASALLIGANGFAAYALSGGERTSYRRISSPWGDIEGLTPPVLERALHALPWRVLIVIATLVLAAMIAAGQTSNWELALKYLHQVSYGQTDPIFGKDIGFYLFSLPVLVQIKDWLLVVIGFSAVLAAAVHWAHGAVAFNRDNRFIAPGAIAHACALFALFLVVEAYALWLERYMLVFGDNGVVVGASYTDVHVELPILLGLCSLCAAGALVALLNARARTLRTPIVIAAALVLLSLVLAPLFTAIFQRFVVKPNELSLEAPYIARNIALTREAYGLSKIVVKPFPADQSLNYSALQRNQATVDNIRLWDWQPLLDTYAQLQEIRTYYKFRDADIDRYRIGGSVQQVMLSAREIDASLLPGNAQTWVNLHLLFTHGNGVVMSPVTRTTPEGLPVLLLHDIPPVSSGGPAISEPRIYFGESPENYIVVKTSTPEFDYPKGDRNVYANYDGQDGVGIGSFVRRVLFAWYFGDLDILLSRYIGAESRVVFRRNIQARVRAVAPFLELDDDPYIVVSGGHLYWIQDAYTTSDWFPYSRPIENGATNYIRNSVKVVIDAYNGSVHFYVSDPSDPLVQTYTAIFPGLFEPMSHMTPDLKSHIRYPEDLFRIQADLYRSYHMNAPEVFYNREDLWQFPRQPTSIDDQTSAATMEPYYINIRLPDESHTEFALMLPMVPNQRDNMIAWLAARCDAPDYGKLIVYEFPKERLVYGPMQIEALINQNPEISQQISLWNQMGSRVIPGNLLVVPIENSLLYVTPLYLRAQTGQLPELKRVIAVYGDHVVMEETLPAALARLFRAPAPGAQPAGQPQVGATLPSTAPASDAARAALVHYQNAIQDLKAGNWSGFGAELDAMKPLLERLNQSEPKGALGSPIKR